MTGFKNCLQHQLQVHRSMLPQDIVKLCYQAACGAEHLLSDYSGAKLFFEDEYELISPKEGPLFEQISESVCRVNMAAWKQTGMPKEWLFRMFVGTVFQTDGKEQLERYLHAAEEVLRQVHYDMESWHAYLDAYRKEGMPAVRHTRQYREKEQPAYRIVGTMCLKLLPILQRIHGYEHTAQPFVIAIDGRAGAGKSTLAELLKNVLDAGIVYMDDFFLPLSMRSEERLAETGGNVHYERFAEQVLPKLRLSDAFTYDVFDCGYMDFNGTRTVSATEYRIVEGSYALHPAFGEYANLRIFVDVEAHEQLRRIIGRNGQELAEKFRELWIPMENRYFEKYKIRENADLIII